MRLGQQVSDYDRKMEELFFQIIDSNVDKGKVALPTHATLNEQLADLEAKVKSLTMAMGGFQPDKARLAIADLLTSVATLYGRMIFAVPARWMAYRITTAHSETDRADIENESMTGILDNLTAIRVMSTLAFATVYVAIEAILRQMTCHLITLADAMGFSAVKDLDDVVNGRPLT